MKYTFIFSFVIVCMLTSCGEQRIKIVDYYYVYDYVDFDYNGNKIDGKSVLMCKLASKDDPLIVDVQSVEWNDKAIIVKTKNDFFVIESNSYGLKCSCGNNTIGPLTTIQINDYKNRTNFMVKEFREINYR